MRSACVVLKGIYYTMPAVPEASRMLSPVNPQAANDAGGVAGPLPPGITPNDILQIEMVRVGSPVSQLADPQNTAQLEQQGHPPEHTPVVSAGILSASVFRF